MNPFFHLPGTSYATFDDSHEEQVFYARVGQAEFAEPFEKEASRTFVRLEAFSQRWFDLIGPPSGSSSPGSDDAFVRYYSEAAIFLLEMEFTRDQTGRFAFLKDLLVAAETDEEPDQWYRVKAGGWLGTGQPNELPALTVFPNIYLEGTRWALAEFEAVDEKTRALLDAAVTADDIEDATEDEITTLLSPVANSTIDWVVVYDVGQGNAIGLCSDSRGVVAYFDFGGGAGANSKSFPTALKTFCFRQNPPVILSHWDEDHWSSATRDPRSLKCDWIAPRQHFDPIQRAVIASIHGAGGKVWFLPAAFPVTRYGQIQIELATGSGRNHSGIILTLAEKQDGSGEQILMPGDASYHYIPSFCSLGGSPYLSMVATHHGGALKSSLIPGCPSLSASRLVYSVGNPNSYRHPLAATRSAHDSNGWIDPAVAAGPSPGLVRETNNRTGSGLGHVLLTWSSSTVSPTLPCGGAGCQLDHQQS